MPTQYPDLFAALAAPFAPGEVKQRNQGGRTLSYHSARTTMNRLDDVLGPENWWDECQRTDKGCMSIITIRLPDGTTLSKTGMGGEAGMADAGDNEMSAESSAFKRAGVKLGIGRYLYRDGVPYFAASLHSQHREDTTRHEPPPNRWHAPREAHDNGNQQEKKPAIQQRPTAGSGWIYFWSKEIGEYYGVDLVSLSQKYADGNKWPQKWKDWSAQQVAEMMTRTARYCSKLPNYAGELDDLLGKSEQQQP